MDPRSTSPEPTTSRPVRILILTVLLALTGGVIGAALGAITTLMMLGPAQALLVPQGLWLGVYVGAIIGGILAPLTGWLLLRQVPLGLAIGGTALGTIAGAVAGLVLGGPTGSVIFAIAGFLGAAVLLRTVAARTGHALRTRAGYPTTSR